MKIDRGSRMRTKSSPNANGLRRTRSPPPRAKGIRVRGKTAVAALTRMAHNDRAGLERRAARGIVNEPTMGTRIVRRAMVSTFIVKI
jgi:hypothetical protein